MSVTCEMKECQEATGETGFMCRRHWSFVSRRTQNLFWRAASCRAFATKRRERTWALAAIREAVTYIKWLERKSS